MTINMMAFVSCLDSILSFKMTMPKVIAFWQPWKVNENLIDCIWAYYKGDTSPQEKSRHMS
jgi:hypothetical protein